MAKQSLFSPANSVLLQVLKTIWHTTKKLQRLKLCFDIIIYSKDTDDSTYGTISRRNHFEQLADPMLKVFLWLQSVWCVLIFFFSAEFRSSHFLLLHSCLRCHHTTLRTNTGTIICANFSFTFVDLTLANILGDGRTVLLCKVQNFTPSIFSIPLLLPSSEIFSAFVAIWDIFCITSQLRYHISRLLPGMFWSN